MCVMRQLKPSLSNVVTCQSPLPLHTVSKGRVRSRKFGTWPVQVHASLIVVLTRGGSTARLVAKYRPSIPVLTVAVPVLTTDSLSWTCSGEKTALPCSREDLPSLGGRGIHSPATELITIVVQRPSLSRYGFASPVYVVPDAGSWM